MHTPAAFRKNTLDYKFSGLVVLKSVYSYISAECSTKGWKRNWTLITSFMALSRSLYSWMIQLLFTSVFCQIQFRTSMVQFGKAKRMQRKHGECQVSLIPYNVAKFCYMQMKVMLKKFGDAGQFCSSLLFCWDSYIIKQTQKYWQQMLVSLLM